MYIKLRDGRHAGEVRDIDNAAAHALLADGRATKAFQQVERPAPRPRASTAENGGTNMAPFEIHVNPSVTGSMAEVRETIIAATARQRRRGGSR